MIRPPEMKKQATMLAQELQANFQISVPRALALEIVSKLGGFKNWRHAAATEPVAVDMPSVELALVFGAEDTSKVEDGENAYALDTFEVKKFATEEEKNAYLQGLKDMQGWDGFAVVEKNTGAPFLRSFAPDEDVNEILALLLEQDFAPAPGIEGEFQRSIANTESNGKGEQVAYQFIIFQSDDTGAQFVNMDCAETDGEYLTETPLFVGKTVLDAVKLALASADVQRANARTCLSTLTSSAKQ